MLVVLCMCFQATAIGCKSSEGHPLPLGPLEAAWAVPDAISSLCNGAWCLCDNSFGEDTRAGVRAVCRC